MRRLHRLPVGYTGGMVLQALATGAVLTRLARGRARRPPLAPAAATATVSVVIPARDEAQRIGACLEALREDPDVLELLVVDDGSTDGTADVARAHGATVVTAPPPPPGWVGKPWALQQGLEAAAGDVVVSLDADTVPRPGLLGGLVAALEDADLVSATARFRCDTAGERWLHPAMLTTLVARFGPPDAPGGRLLANGQCTAGRRRALLDAGGYAAAAGHLTDDAAFARGLAASGRRVEVRDGSDLLLVDMHDGMGTTWREWGRSIALADVTPPGERLLDVLVVWLVLALPVLRLLRGRPTRLDLGLLGLRGLLLAATSGSYERRGPAFWLSPLADPVAAVALTRSALRPSRRWRGRDYGGAR